MNQKGFSLALLLIGLIILILISGLMYYIVVRPFADPNSLLASHYRNINCDILIGQMIKPGNDIIQIEKDVCIGERAWFESNPNFCSGYSNPDQCYGWMAIKTNNLSLCNSMTKKTGYFWIQDKLALSSQDNAWLYECYSSFANWRNDQSVCNQIPYKDDSLRQDCENTVSKWGNNYLKFKDSPI